MWACPMEGCLSSRQDVCEDAITIKQTSGTSRYATRSSQSHLVLTLPTFSINYGGVSSCMIYSSTA